LELSKTEGIPDGSDIRIRAKLTHQEMADVIGCTRETVTNSLGLLRKQRVIRIDHRSITIRNIERLSRMVS
jgi:CRP-like cAMP-binding protein